MTKHIEKKEGSNLSESLGRLSDIVKWFESEEGIDVEAGLAKVKEGAALIKACKERLSKIENEFKEIQKDLADSGEDAS